MRNAGAGPPARFGWLFRSNSFERKLQLTLLAIFLTGSSVAGLSYWKSVQSAYLLERSRLAHQVLQAFLQLSSATYELYKVLGLRILASERGVPLTAALTTEAELIERIEGKVKQLRRLIADEVAFVGNAPDEDEKEEFERLAAIEQRITAFLREYGKLKVMEEGWDTIVGWRRLSAVLDETMDREFRRLIKDGIAEETKEVEAADRQARELISLSRRFILLATVLGIALSLLGAGMLIRNVRRPLGELSEGMDEFAAGDLSRRVAVRSHDEFGRLAQRFNEMAEELDARRSASEVNRLNLERMVDERTRSLNELNSSLGAADQTRRRFLADLSHELRTPLTIIRGESEIMLRGAERDIEEYRGSLAKILEQAKHTTTLVDDLLFIARREAGEARLRFQPVDLGRLIAQICQETKALLQEKHLTLHCRTELPGANTTVTADPAKLRQVMLILIDNAIRYSTRNGRIDVALMSAPEGLAILVADNGIGISPDDLPFLFERFYRGSNAGAQHAEGVGLGLPVAKAIIDAHAGTIRIESEPDRGTRITVTLPGTPKLRAIA